MVARLFFVLAILLLATPMAAAAQDASPASDASCAVAPRSVDDLLDIWFGDGGSSGAPAAGGELARERALDLALGEPADEDVAAAMEAVAAEWIACTNAGDWLRADALLTDAYARRQRPNADTAESARALLEASPVPRAADAMLAIGPAHDPRLFPDGWAGATFAVTGLRQPGEALAVFMLFERADDGWRIGAMVGVVAPPPTAPVSPWRVLAEHPHDPNAYTQGLVLVDGALYEGTGLEGRSELRRVDLDTGEVLESHALAPDEFGEGIVVMGDRIYQITWKNGICYVYDRASFALLDTFAYSGEGWGLTTDGELLIMSDGSDRLFLRDPETFDIVETVRVQDGGLPVANLNELEYVDGEVWANVYQTDWIVRIDPTTGDVIGWLDMAALRPDDDPRWDGAEVLNGIAWDPDSGRLLVTGKLWPSLFEIELIPSE